MLKVLGRCNDRALQNDHSMTVTCLTVFLLRCHSRKKYANVIYETVQQSSLSKQIDIDVPSQLCKC